MRRGHIEHVVQSRKLNVMTGDEKPRFCSIHIRLSPQRHLVALRPGTRSARSAPTVWVHLIRCWRSNFLTPLIREIVRLVSSWFNAYARVLFHDSVYLKEIVSSIRLTEIHHNAVYMPGLQAASKHLLWHFKFSLTPALCLVRDLGRMDISTVIDVIYSAHLWSSTLVWLWSWYHARLHYHTYSGRKFYITADLCLSSSVMSIYISHMWVSH